MRKIEQQMIDAIREGRGFNGGNTTVHHRWDEGVEVRLYGHLIAWRSNKNHWEFNLCGYDTNTTRSRITALMSQFCPEACGVFTKNGQASVRYRDKGVQLVPSDGWFTADLP